jgi:hypothetical protein
MDFVTLKEVVAGMLNRSVSDFTAEGEDHLAYAINQAQLLAQRLIDFELMRTEGYLPLTENSANWRTAMLDGLGGSSITPYKLVAIATDEDIYNDIKLVTESDRRRLENASHRYAYLVGSTLKVKPSDAVDGVYTVFFEKLADLDADVDTNILTDNCADWLAQQAAFDLAGGYLKEQARLTSMAGSLRYRWDSVVAWNSSFTTETDVSLD